MKMGKHRQSHKVHLSALKVILSCEWGGCQYQTMSMPHFVEHLEGHFEDFLPEGVTADNYTRHRLEETEETPCQWADCDYSSSFPILLLRHLYFHGYHTKVKGRGHAFLEQLPDVQRCQTDRQHRNLVHEVISPFTCQWQDCEYYTDNIEAFMLHVENHSDFRIQEELVCRWQGCGLIMKNKYKLKGHMSAHTQQKKFGCHNCGSMFYCSTKFLDHLHKQIPLNEQNFQCSHCSKIFSTQRLLRDHVRRHVNHYKCPLCNMTCQAPSNLRNHIKYRHSSDRPWPCDYCSVRCRDKSDLVRHLQTHLDVATFWCDFKNCTYKAKSSVSLRKHYQREHLKMDIRKFCCHICGVRYTFGARLTSHLKKKHKFKWPSGFTRFRYKEHEDGLFRLQTVRYESLEITEHLLQDEALAVADQSQGSPGGRTLTVGGREMEVTDISVGGSPVNMLGVVDEDALSSASSNDAFRVTLQDAGVQPCQQEG